MNLGYYKKEFAKYGARDFLLTRYFYLLDKVLKPLRRLFRLYVSPIWEITDSGLLSQWRERHTGILELLDDWEHDMEKSFFISSADKKIFSGFMEREFPEHISAALEEAARVMENTYDILGSGPIKLSDPLPWDTDIKTGHRYGGYSQNINYNNTESNDPKVPWELSRFNFAITLGKAYWYTGDEAYAKKYTRLLEDWIEKNPYDWGVNWICPMEAAIRPVGMMWGYHFFARSSNFSPELKIKFIKTLIQHAHFLLWNLEGNPYGHYNNHYFTNGFGLFCLGTFLKKHGHGLKWLSAGRKILERETEKQVFADGVHYEQAIGYHKLILDILLSSVILAGKNKIRLNVIEKLEKMLDFTADYTRADGSTPTVADCDDGKLMNLSPSTNINDHRGSLATGCVILQKDRWNTGVFCEETFWLAGGQNAFSVFTSQKPSKKFSRSNAYPKSGYYIMKSENIHIIADCGPYGFHGHNDLLSFDLYAYQRPMICDPGTYVYSSDYTWSNRFRSTYFHNTVGIDGKETSPFNDGEYWGLGKENRYEVSEWVSDNKKDIFSGKHFNYSYIQDDIVHERKMLLDKENEKFFLHDHIHGSGVHTLLFIFNLGESLKHEVIGGAVVAQDSDGRGVVIMPLEHTANVKVIKPSIKNGWISREFGRKTQTKKIYYVIKTKLPFSMRTVVMPFKDGLFRNMSKIDCPNLPFPRRRESREQYKHGFLPTQE